MRIEEALKYVRRGGCRLLFGGKPAKDVDDYALQDILCGDWGYQHVPQNFYDAVRCLVAAGPGAMIRRSHYTTQYHIRDGYLTAVCASSGVSYPPNVADMTALDWILEDGTLP